MLATVFPLLLTKLLHLAMVLYIQMVKPHNTSNCTDKCTCINSVPIPNGLRTRLHYDLFHYVIYDYVIAWLRSCWCTAVAYHSSVQKYGNLRPMLRNSQGSCVMLRKLPPYAVSIHSLSVAVQL